MSPVPQTNPCCPTPQPVPRSCPTAQHMSPEAAPQHNTCPLNQLVHTGVSNADCNMHISSTLQLVIVHQIKSSCPKPQPKPTRATPHHNPYPPNQLVLLHTTTPIHQINLCYSTPHPLSTKPARAAPHTTTPIHQTNSYYSTPQTLSTKPPYPPTRAIPHQTPYPPN